MIENVYLMHCYSHDYSLICLVAVTEYDMKSDAI